VPEKKTESSFNKMIPKTTPVLGEMLTSRFLKLQYFQVDPTKEVLSDAQYDPVKSQIESFNSRKKSIKHI
jgi:hypothetical protein